MATAWTAPRTWTNIEIVTETMLNTHLRDNLLFLVSPPAARVYRTTNQSISSGTLTAISFDAERGTDPWAMWTVGTPTRVTIPSSPAGGGGMYALAGNVQWASTAVQRTLQIRLNGTTIVASDELPPAASASVVSHSVFTIVQCAAGDYVELLVQQSSGGSINVNTVSAYSPELAVHWLGAGT